MPAWTDDPATTTTPIRLAHVNELRRTVNFYRAAAGLSPFSWTDAPYVDNTTPIKAVHFTELRTAIQDLWTAHGLGTIPAWSAGSAPASNAPIWASNVNDLRAWVTRADPPLSIWTGFHWCSPVNGTDNPAAQPLLQRSGRWGAVLITAGAGDFQDACNRVMAARSANGGGASLDQCIVRLYYGGAGHPNLTDINGVAAAGAWLQSNGYYDLLNYFVTNGGRYVVPFNELDNAAEPQQGIDPRVMGYLAYALASAYTSGDQRSLYVLFPGPAGLQPQANFNNYWIVPPVGRGYDLWSGGPGTQQTFGQAYGAGVDSAIAARTMLFHGGQGVYDGVALHCYAQTRDEYVSGDPGVNRALQYLQWLRDTVDASGPVYVTETGYIDHLGCPNAPACDCGNTDLSGSGLAIFEALADTQFGAQAGGFLRAAYGYILQLSNCDANADGRHAIDTAFIDGYLAAKSFP